MNHPRMYGDHIGMRSWRGDMENRKEDEHYHDTSCFGLRSLLDLGWLMSAPQIGIVEHQTEKAKKMTGNLGLQ